MSVLGFNLKSSPLLERPGGGLIDVLGGGAEMTPFTDSSDPSVWHESWKREFFNELGWTLRYDVLDEYLEFNQSWYCEDKNPATPYVNDISFFLISYTLSSTLCMLFLGRDTCVLTSDLLLFTGLYLMRHGKVISQQVVISIRTR
jgi:hypothetical protein